jgi:hypothetical protein
MFRRSGERYVILQEYMPTRERRAMERALVSVMLPVAPSQSFVDRLSQDLVEEARRQQSAQRRHADQTLRFFGIFGGLVSVVGGLILWIVLRQERNPEPGTAQAFSGQGPSAVPRSA